MIIKHPTNCECEYDFPHSMVITSRITTISGVTTKRTVTYVVCRDCNHWIDSPVKCWCVFYCHQQPGGTEVVTTALDMVNCP